MADDINDSLRRMNDDLKKQSSIQKAIGDKITDNMKSVLRNSTRMDKTLDSFVNNATYYGRELKDAAKNIKSVSGVVGAFGVSVGIAADIISDSIDVYRQLNNIGQTFNGSLLSMQIAAAEAALPLKDFAELVEKNSLAIAASGVKSFTDLGKTARANLKEFGMLGLTTSQFNDYLSEYAETQRLYGSVQNLNSVEAAKSLELLAKETTKMSVLTGKNRTDIMKQSQQALRTASLQVMMAKLSSTATGTFKKALESTTIYMAGLPGEAGTALSNMLTETVGLGTSAVSAGIQDFNKIGLGAVGGMMDDLARKVKDGTITESDRESFRKNLTSLLGNNLDSLQAQLLGPNADLARKAIGMYSELNSIVAKNTEEVKKQQKATNFFLSIEESMQQFSGFLRERFYKSFERVYETLQASIKSGAFSKLGTVISGLFDSTANAINNFLKPENLDSFATSLSRAINTLGQFSDSFVDNIYAPFASAVSWFDTNVFSPLQKSVGTMYAAAILFGTYITGKFLAGAVIDKFKGKFSGTDDPFKRYSSKPGIIDINVTNSSGKNRTSRLNKNSSQTSHGTTGNTGGFMKGKGKALGGGILGAGLIAASSLMPEGFEGLTAITGYASIGASIGSIIPGIGTVVGGIIGGALGLISNWEIVTKELSTALDYGKEKLGSIYTNYIEPFTTWATDAWKNFKFNSITDTITSWFISLKDEVFGTISSLWNRLVEFKTYVGNLGKQTLSGAVDLLKSGTTAVGSIFGINPTSPAQKQNTLSPQTTQNSTTVPTINVDSMKKQIDDLNIKNAQLAEDNRRTRMQLDRLIDLIAKGNSEVAAYLKQITDNGTTQNRTLKSGLGTY